MGRICILLTALLLSTQGLGCDSPADGDGDVDGDGDADGDVDGDVDGDADGDEDDGGGERTVPPGGSCSCDTDCMSFEGTGICVAGVCWVQPSGPCEEPTGDQPSEAGCGPGLHCWTTTMGTREIDLCWPDCGAYDCVGECDEYDECGATDSTNASCDPECAFACFGGTTTEDWTCSAEHPEDGDCPDGEVCRSGSCEPFVCDSPPLMEPNETQAAALAVTGSVEGLQICARDHDWYSVAPTEAGVLHLIGVRSFYGSGDLEVDIHDAGGTQLADAGLVPNDYHADNGRGPIELEAYTIAGAPEAETFFFHVFGRGGDTNDYGFVHETIRWTDGPSCPAAGFSTRECTAISGSSFYPSELVLFPMAHAADPYVGGGFTFVSGFDGRSFMPTSVMWGRRDLVMALRHAMHVVQAEFPGTQPLGIGEISMPDGTTPGGHPNFTHHYGGNVDISYFIVPEAEPLGQLSYRQICNDALTLRDWSCVDQDGRAGQFGECITGCGDGHIVDVPRTARFMAAIAEAGRLRVFGVDTSVVDELETELLRLAREGVAGASTANSRMASANDDSSWVWHFNHIHISFN